MPLLGNSPPINAVNPRFAGGIPSSCGGTRGRARKGHRAARVFDRQGKRQRSRVDEARFAKRGKSVRDSEVLGAGHPGIPVVSARVRGFERTRNRGGHPAVGCCLVRVKSRFLRI